MTDRTFSDASDVSMYCTFIRANARWSKSVRRPCSQKDVEFVWLQTTGAGAKRKRDASPWKKDSKI